jgi:prefoldin subunit 5
LSGVQRRRAQLVEEETSLRRELTTFENQLQALEQENQQQNAAETAALHSSDANCRQLEVS